MESTLFIELSEEQQQTIAAGGPTTALVDEFASFDLTQITNESFAVSTVVAGPDGSGATGAANSAESELFISSFAEQISESTSG